MKITTVFFTKKNSFKNKYIKKEIKQIKQNCKVSTASKKIRFGSFAILVLSAVVFKKNTNIPSSVVYFGSNFRQAQEKNVKFADVFKMYGIYNKENYVFNENLVAKDDKKIDFNEELKNSDTKVIDDTGIYEILDNEANNIADQSVFGKMKEVNVEVTENSKNIQRISLNNMKILNYSSKRDIDFKTLATSDITLTIKSDKILLYNTHTSESYANSEKYSFEYSGARRSQDASYNMLSVAKKFKENLDKKGFEVVQDTTPHDYGTYTSSYARSRITAKNALAQMGNAGIIIDVHRDAIDDLDFRPVVEIKGVNVAQCMLVMGVGTDVTENPYYEDNLKLALKIQQIADEMYPGLFRPMIIRNSIYNQDLNKYSLLIEVGASGNTLDEAYLATRCLANLLNVVYKD